MTIALECAALFALLGVGLLAWVMAGARLRRRKPAIATAARAALGLPISRFHDPDEEPDG